MAASTEECIMHASMEGESAAIFPSEDQAWSRSNRHNHLADAAAGAENLPLGVQIQPDTGRGLAPPFTAAKLFASARRQLEGSEIGRRTRSVPRFSTHSPPCSNRNANALEAALCRKGLP
ncbi:hypothetical protein M569_11179 [Genlisea aurea]|uniref:Uncharacterized protein n=1 Tax=Genlisea aurea TaxID=192259 RepID=S8C9X3_9LAMI|nr:hypothetical protein M569_11179 [Genlisea aurea]